MSAQGGAVLGAQTIPKLKMPKADGFISLDLSQYKPGTSMPFPAIFHPAPQKK